MIIHRLECLAWRVSVNVTQVEDSFVDPIEKIEISCSHCDKKFRVTKKYLGKKVRCSVCKESFLATPFSDSESGMNWGDDLNLENPAGSDRNSSNSGNHAGNFAPTAAAEASYERPATKRCPDCHQYISEDQFQNHRASHDGYAEDGQQNLYSTLPPEDRIQGPLKGVPKIYHHNACGVKTGMPEDIIRTYLVNPWFYGNSSFCCGCEKHIGIRELYWVETKQSLHDCNRELRRKCPEKMKYLGGLFLKLAIYAAIGGFFVGGFFGLISFAIGGLIVGLAVFVLGFFFASLLVGGGLLFLRGGV